MINCLLGEVELVEYCTVFPDLSTVKQELYGYESNGMRTQPFPNVKYFDYQRQWQHQNSTFSFRDNHSFDAVLLPTWRRRRFRLSILPVFPSLYMAPVRRDELNTTAFFRPPKVEVSEIFFSSFVIFVLGETSNTLQTLPQQP